MNTSILKKNTFYPKEVRLDLFLLQMRQIHRHNKLQQARFIGMNRFTLNTIERNNHCNLNTLQQLAKGYKMESWEVLRYSLTLDPRNYQNG